MIARSPPMLLIGLIAVLWLVLRLVFVAGEKYIDGPMTPISLEEWLYPDMSTSVPLPSKLMPWNFPSVDMPPLANAQMGGRRGMSPVDDDGDGEQPLALSRAALAPTGAALSARALQIALPVNGPRAELQNGDTLPRQYQVMLAHLLSPTRLSNRRSTFLMAGDGGAQMANAGIGASRDSAVSMARTRNWLVALWAYYRPDALSIDAPIPSGNGPAQLGGSQLGGRAAVRLGQRGQGEAFMRIVSAGRQMRDAEGAIGVAMRPISRVPVQLVAERRQRLAGQDGRSAFATYAVGGVSDAPVAAGWRIDSYGAAGIVGARQRDLFAQGQIRVTHDVVRLGGLRISGGAGGWAGAQAGASRADIGPTIDARLDNQRADASGLVGSPRLSIDWRQRVTGQAAPTSGLAITLATDF